jgi:hypothetical protein
MKYQSIGRVEFGVCYHVCGKEETVRHTVLGAIEASYVWADEVYASLLAAQQVLLSADSEWTTNIHTNHRIERGLVYPVFAVAKIDEDGVREEWEFARNSDVPEAIRVKAEALAAKASEAMEAVIREAARTQDLATNPTPAKE